MYLHVSLNDDHRDAVQLISTTAGRKRLRPVMFSFSLRRKTMSKLRLLISISTAALFAVTAGQANEYYRTNHTPPAAKAANGKKSPVNQCKPYGDTDLQQMCGTHKTPL
jgi:hypothetical protein